MKSQRLLIKTSKGVQTLLEGNIGLDDKHVRILGLLDGTRQIGSLAETTGYSDQEVQAILQKLMLIGYARSIGSAAPTDSKASSSEASSTFFPSGSDTFGGDHYFPDKNEEIDIASIRSAAKSREHGMANTMNLGSAEDVWKQTHDLAQQLMNDRLAREHEQRQAAERALAEAKAREAELEKARKEAEEALAKSKEEARARAKAAAEAESLRQQAYELEQARSRRLGIYRKRMRMLIAAAAITIISIWSWRASNSAHLDAAACSQLLSQWSQIESSVNSCKTSFFPVPRYEASGISIGKIDAANIEGNLSLLPLFFGQIEPTSLSIHGLHWDANSIAALLRSPHKGRLGSVREVDIDGSRLSMGGVIINGLKGQASLDAQGQLDHLALVDDEHLARLTLANEKGLVKFSLQARFADPESAPFKSAIDLSAYGTLDRDRMVIEDGSVGFKNGQAMFSGEIAWAASQWMGQGKVDIRSIGLADIAPWIFNSGTADLSGKFSFDSETPSLALLDGRLDVAGPGRNVSLKIDLPEILGVSGSMGFSAFPQAALQLRLSQRSQNFILPSLSSGPFRANVDASLSANGKVSGSANASMPDRGMSAEMMLSGNRQRIDLSPRQRGFKP